MTDPEMTWPTLRHKLGRPHFIWFRHSLGWWVALRSDYYGTWFWLQMGRLAFRTGYGTYE